MPLLGESSPNVRSTQLALDAELLLVRVRIDERRVGDAVRDQVDLGLGHAVDLAQELDRFLVMTTTRADRSASSVRTRRWSGRVAQDGVEGRDDRHPQVRAAGRGCGCRPAPP